MTHSLGGLSDLPHGECNALRLESVIDYHYELCPERHEVIAQVMHVDCSSHDVAVIKQKLLSVFRSLITELGIAERLRDPGVTREHIPELAKNSMWDPVL